MAVAIKKISDSRQIEVTAAGAVPALHIKPDCPGGRPFGVRAGLKAAAAGDIVVYDTEGKFQLPILTTLVQNAGTPVYWDEADGELNADDTNNPFAGTLILATANGETIATVMINESPADAAV